MRARIILVTAISAIALVAGAVLVHGATTSATPPTATPPPGAHATSAVSVTLGAGTVVPAASRVPLPATATGDPNSMPLTGAPAIMPKTTATTPSTPTYTAQDASDFALAHLPSQLQGAPVTVKNVVFINNSDALTQLQTGIGGIPDRLLCVVQMGGTFTVSAPGYSRSATTANMLFDGQTGNYLGLTIPYKQAKLPRGGTRSAVAGQ